MAHKRILRVGEAIKRELSFILDRKIKQGPSSSHKPSQSEGLLDVAARRPEHSESMTEPRADGPSAE